MFAHSMFAHPLFARRLRLAAVLVFITSFIAPLHSVPAATAVDAGQYGLSVRHSVLSQVALGNGKQQLKLALSIANHGAHDLYDLRILPVRLGFSTVLEEHPPARLRTLHIGEQATVTWTLLLPPGSSFIEPADGAILRIEAVDQDTQQIVVFNQHSLEDR